VRDAAVLGRRALDKEHEAPSTLIYLGTRSPSWLLLRDVILSTNVYDFERQRELGAIGESIIRGVFARQFTIQRSVALEQRQGIDFWFSYGAFDLAVEVKTDFTAAHTRNAFIEVTSIDVDGKPG